MGEIADAVRRAKQEGDLALEEPPPRSRQQGLPPATDLRGEPPRRPGPDVEIPPGRVGSWQARIVWVERGGRAAESFRHLALRVRTELERRNESSLLVTSALPSEGKTLTACNLALALASLAGRGRIALVDLDLRNPGVARCMGIGCEVGLEHVLRGEADLDAVALRTDVPSLDLYPVQHRVGSPHELLARHRLARVLGELASRYEAVVCDSPPALAVPDVELIAEHVGACMAVVRAGKTLRGAFLDLVELLPREKTIGCFLNEARQPRHARKYRRDCAGEDDAAGQLEEAQ